MARTARYRFGQILWASIHDGVRTTKQRPVVIIDKDTDYTVDDDILVVAISTRCESPCPDYHIQVHGSHKLDEHTGLSQPCWAKCNFPRYLKAAKLGKPIGNMPLELLEEIVDTFDRLCADDSFDNWQ